MSARVQAAGSRWCLLALVLAAGQILPTEAAPPLRVWAGKTGRRALLRLTSKDAACGGADDLASSSALLSTSAGFFRPKQIGHTNNLLLMASLSNDVYPWAAQYGITMFDVAGGLTKQQENHFQRLFRKKYSSLGARRIEFVDWQESLMGAAGHAVVLTSDRDVFVAIRGTADIGQMRITGKLHSAPWVQPVFNTTLQLLYPAQQSMAGLWPLLDAAITRAIDATANPAAARIFLTGHSLGGASACIAALLLASEGRRVSGVWAFDPYKTGTRCAAGQNCWVSLYDRHLGNVTVAVWNNQDPIPQLVDASSPQPAASDWGHVPSDRGWVRIVGDACLPASGTPLMDACPPEVAAAGGSTDGKCASPFGDHLPWVVLRRIASCALLQGSAGRDVLALPRDVSAARVAVAAAKESGAVSTSTYACTQGAVWTKLLGLSPPGRR